MKFPSVSVHNGIIFTCMKRMFLAYLLLVSAVGRAQSIDTFKVMFALKETTVNLPSAAYLDNLVKKVIRPADKISIFAYADYRGTPEHNDSVSNDRAVSVRDYLLQKGISKDAIVACEGKGKIEREGMTGKYGYAPDRKVLIIVQSNETKMDIDKLKVNETVNLRNIFFEGNRPDILLSSMPEMENLYNFLSANKRVSISIEGHACCKGLEISGDVPYGSDQKLSELRAKAIYDYLGAKGISRKRMKYVGYGTTRPLIYPATTEDEQQQNRRVEIRILSK